MRKQAENQKENRGKGEKASTRPSGESHVLIYAPRRLAEIRIITNADRRTKSMAYGL